MDDIIGRLLPLSEDKADPTDPQKIWAILHYPDGLEISPSMLLSLLKNLSTHEDDAVSILIIAL